MMMHEIEDRVIAATTILGSLGVMGFWFLMLIFAVIELMEGSPLNEYIAVSLAIQLIPFVILAGFVMWRGILLWQAVAKQKPK